MEKLVGTLERIVFENDDNGYTVARFAAVRRYDLITVVGNLAGVHAGARWGDLGSGTGVGALVQPVLLPGGIGHRDRWRAPRL